MRAGRHRLFKKLLLLAITGFVLMNVVAWFHASKFTHFDRTAVEKTKDPGKLSFAQKLKTLFTGVSNPRPANTINPSTPYETIMLQSNRQIECWYIKSQYSGEAKGTVILFHGFSAAKSTMLDRAEIFLDSGYHALLVDFMGSGGSEGDQTSVGYLEAEQVKTAYEYLVKKGEKKIILVGTSMGAAAIMKAENDHQLHPYAIILECPFGTMLETVQARFKTMHVPSFPMANLLVFWGGRQNGFNAFNHNPAEYAKNIHCPVLLLHGGKDEKVSLQEIFRIFGNLTGEKELKVYLRAAHENYLNEYKSEWTTDVMSFLSNRNGKE